MFIKKIKNFYKYSILFLLIILTNNARAEFFEDLSKIIENNEKRLSYGISVTDFNMDGNNEFLVTGCLLYTSPSPRDLSTSRMPSSA